MRLKANFALTAALFAASVITHAASHTPTALRTASSATAAAETTALSAEQKTIALRQQVIQDQRDYRAAVRANNPTAATAAQVKLDTDMKALRPLRAQANAEAQQAASATKAAITATAAR